MKAAIVEDDIQAMKALQGYFDRYAQQSNLPIETTAYSSAVEFLDQYDMSFDLVLMDIQMPQMNGMRAAEQLRAVDSKILIVFVTNLAKYAVDSYTVGALDFILKPISYFAFSNMLDKVCRVLEYQQLPSLLISTKREVRRIPVSLIRYVTIHGHKLYYHLDHEQIESWGTLSALKESLPARMFSQINAGTMVNLNTVVGIRDDVVVLPKETLPLSRRRKKEFCEDLAYYLGEKFHV